MGASEAALLPPVADPGPRAPRLHRRALIGGAAALALGGCAPRRSPAPALTDARAPGTRRRAPEVASPRATSPSPPRPAPAIPAPDPPLLLLRRYPELGQHLHPRRLARLPTPVSHAAGLGAAIGVPRLYVKHDDLTATPYGGGKVRKLELFLGEALHEGRREVVTSGAVASHHALATATYARELGLACTLLLMHGGRAREACEALLAEHHQGAALELVGGPAGVARAIRQRVAREPTPYVIPGGGPSPLGNLAYVNAALELGAQVEAGQLPAPDMIVVALGTMGTAVGLTLGLELLPFATSVVAVRVANLPTSTPERFRAELAATRAWLTARGVAVPAPRGDRVRIEGRYLDAGYGLPTVAGDRAIRLAAGHGLRLDATYTAKAFAAIVDGAAASRDRVVLFWHTHSAVEAPTGASRAVDLPGALRGYCLGAPRIGASSFEPPANAAAEREGAHHGPEDP